MIESVRSKKLALHGDLTDQVRIFLFIMPIVTIMRIILHA